MKKVCIGLGLCALPLALMLGGCSQSQLEMVKENISEITYEYFYGKCDDFEIAISSGEREEPYTYDGERRELCDFALVVARLDCKKENETLTFSINGDASSEILEYNIMTGTYMLDLEKQLLSTDVISVKYGNTQITLDNLSSTFATTYERAIEIGTNEFAEELTTMTEQGELKGECYLKVLDNLSNNFDNYYWCFSVVNREGEHLNCIIDIESGEVVAKT